MDTEHGHHPDRDAAARTVEASTVDASTVERLVRRLDGWDQPAMTVRPLAGGITNRNLLVTAGDRRVVARLPGARTELLGIDRANEAEAASRAASLGIGPALLGVLPEIGTALTEYVDGTHLDGDAFVDRLDDVVRVLRALHDSGPLRGEFPVHRIVERHARDAAAHGVAVPQAYPRLRSASQRIEAAMARARVPAAPCHNDLLPGNVLFERVRADGRQPRVLLLDFEYAGMNDPSFDLGNLSVNCGLGAEGDEALLRAYYGDVSASAWARLQLMKVMSEFREGMWAVVQQAISDLDTDFVAYADERLGHCEHLAASPEFAGWLDAV